MGIGASILTGVGASQQAGSYAANATNYGLLGINNIAQQSGTIGIVLAAAILIGIVVSAFYMGGSQRAA